MSKKDYQAIARAIYVVFGDKNESARGRLGTHGDYCRQRVAEELAAAIGANNPKFDRARFLEACETGKCKGMPR